MKLSLPRRRAVRDPGAQSPQLSTSQPRCPITADRGKPQGGESTLNFVFKGAAEIQVDATLETTASQTPAIPAEYKTRLALRIATVTMAICAAASPLNTVAVKGTSGITPP